MTELAHQLEKLPYFIAIAETGSFQAAAKKLRIAQPSLSRAIRILEDTLECRLFERSRRGVQLTGAGEQLLSFAKDLLRQTALAQRTLITQAKGVRGIVRVGTHEILLQMLGPQLIKQLRREAPQLTLELSSTFSVNTLEQQLASGEADIIIGVELSNQNSTVRHKLVDDHYGMYANQPLASKLRLALSRKSFNASDFPFLFLPHAIAGPKQRLQAALLAAGIDISPRYVVETFESIVTLASTGLGIAILPNRPAHALMKKNGLVPVFPSSHGYSGIGAHSLFMAIRATDIHSERIHKVATVSQALFKSN